MPQSGEEETMEFYFRGSEWNCSSLERALAERDANPAIDDARTWQVDTFRETTEGVKTYQRAFSLAGRTLVWARGAEPVPCRECGQLTDERFYDEHSLDEPTLVPLCTTCFRGLPGEVEDFGARMLGLGWDAKRAAWDQVKAAERAQAEIRVAINSYVYALEAYTRLLDRTRARLVPPQGWLDGIARERLRLYAERKALLANVEEFMATHWPHLRYSTRVAGLYEFWLGRLKESPQLE